ncbi:MAG: Stk1 family PASTA domain-containing Ser/Thr kinase [Anaerolineae bacterium]
MSEPIIFNNRYQILDKLGEGGLAEVYRAQDVALGRLVAVKALRREYVLDPAFLVRFHREAQSAASLTHPNIVAVYDFGQDLGRPYIVMEYVPGRDLRTIINERRVLSVDQAVEIGLQVCAAVGYAHRAGLVHGDIKPGNVLITPDGRAKVVDFGLARSLGESAMDEEGELVWGTPAYFAPEQAAGDRVLPATDVYAIGVILYEMLTGQLPFTGSDSEVAHKHLYAIPTPADQVNPRIPYRLARLIDTAMNKQPGARFSTADHMRQALADFRQSGEGQTGYHIPASRPTPTQAVTDSTSSATQAVGVDWIGLTLGFLAVVAVLGLVPLWATVYRTYVKRPIPANIPTPTATLAVGQVRVPDVIGMEEEDARQVLESAGLQLEVIGQAFHPTIPPFAIIDQTVRAGEPVAEGTGIGVVISQGPELLEVPSLIGKSLDEALAQVQSAGLIAQSQETWSEQPPGIVIDQDPPAGSLVQTRSLVSLTVSSGKRVAVEAVLEDKILLMAYELPYLEYRPGDTVLLSLIWQAIRSPGRGYTVFVHLTRADGSLVSQHDGLPAGGARPTDTWAPGDQITDEHQFNIPPDTPPGEYWLRVGMYDSAGRLAVTDPGQATTVDGVIVLRSITVN